jgi:cytochrome c oxidase cbb3-type subunit 3
VAALTSCAQNNASPAGGTIGGAKSGRTLFLKNCAHCHGADAHGDEGPDLYNLDWSNGQIATRIQNGKKGQMTAFADKLSGDQIGEIINYLRTLR